MKIAWSIEEELVNSLDNTQETAITVIIAALNEEEGIGPTIAELKAALGEPVFLVVDGHSIDKTAEIARRMGARVLEQEGLGKGGAIEQAITHIDSGTDYVVFIDADFTYPAAFVPQMIGILEETPEVGMVTGNRFNHKLRLSSMRSPYFIGNRFLAMTQRLLNGVKLRDPLTGLRVVRTRILRDWTPKSRGFDVEAELNHLVEKRGYQTVEIPIEYRRRLGEKKLKLRDGFTILRRMLLESLRSIA
ncbi:MAG: glycosyltransferase [Candidatus Bathyarchaeota archaeon]|nr:MAG: glycosyltransferase [Candidatus Bathyarchaeota archaeon]